MCMKVHVQMVHCVCIWIAHVHTCRQVHERVDMVKNPVYPHQNPVHLQKSPTCIYSPDDESDLSKYIIFSQKILTPSAKNPCISVKEMHIFSKEPYMSAKEPYIFSKRARHIRKTALHLRQRALHIRKRALHIRKRALHIRKRVLHICKRALHSAKEYPRLILPWY